MIETNRQLDDRIREIADKFGTSETKSQILDTLKILKEDIIDNVVSGVKDSILNVEAKLRLK